MFKIKNNLWSKALLMVMLMFSLTCVAACGDDDPEPVQEEVTEGNENSGDDNNSGEEPGDDNSGSNEDPEQPGEKGKVLLVYFSWGGNTRAVATQIQELAGCDIVEVEPEEAYPDTYETVRPIAYEELENGSRPIKTKVNNMTDYDILIVGTPIWGGHLTPPMKLFLQSYDLNGKTIAPFSTHQGSGLGQSVSDIRSVCPNSTILTGMPIASSQINTSRTTIENWLKQCGIIE